MQLRGERDGQGSGRGVSHVIGVALMIAITVLLVAAVGVYAAGFGDTVRDPAPTVSTTTSFDDRWDPHGQYFNVTHENGDSVETATLRLDVNGAEWYDPTTGASGRVTLESDVIESQVGEAFTAGETLSIERRNFTTAGGSALPPDRHVHLGDATVRIVYETPDAERSEPVYTCHVSFPDCESAPG